MKGYRYRDALLELILLQLAAERGLILEIKDATEHTREVLLFNPMKEPISFLRWIIIPGRRLVFTISEDGTVSPARSNRKGRQ